ncbi:Hypothetical predicted protein [Paramuricea clavata]|uniref:Uncharacterized protein n=1 Tax=Paramuricea clavata TaxID=317549 RepID=A0A6S7FGM8_PARCT|nr:Hypothetical predicted protein [Paramuricea clavata]
MEGLFQRKHNQMSYEERGMVEKNKKEIASRITHVIDCEAYMNKKKTFLREISVYRVKTGECASFQVYTPFVPFNEHCYTIDYQIKKIHGLPIVRKRLTGDFYTLKESMAFLTDEFMCNADLVGYKDGDIERNLLNNMGVRCINLEVLTCPKMAMLEALSYLLLKQPYNPTLWNLYSTCTYLRFYKPLMVKERKINHYSEVKGGCWLKGGFETIRDFIAVDDVKEDDEKVKSDNPATPDLVWEKNPRMGVDEDGGKKIYNIPVEWIPQLGVREGLFVLFPYPFCCREVLVHSKTQLVHCQSLNMPRDYYVDKHYFHVGSGDCDEDSSEIEVFAGTQLYVGLMTMMKHFKTNLYVNMGEMLTALDSNEKVLQYYRKEVRSEENENGEVAVTVIYHVEKKIAMAIRKYLAHILVCKKCIRYIEEFLSLSDQSVEEHPYPAHSDLDCDGYNCIGLPILRHILDADFDSLRDKAFYGVVVDVFESRCERVEGFMTSYVIKYV